MILKRLWRASLPIPVLLSITALSAHNMTLLTRIATTATEITMAQRYNHHNRNRNSFAEISKENIELYTGLDAAHHTRLADNTTFHDSGTLPTIPPPSQAAETRISVEYGDTLAIAKEYLAENPCVLNMSSLFTPGGGWLRGTTAQEEMICYRSDLYVSLQLHADKYPLEGCKSIYSSGITVFRNDAMAIVGVRDQYTLSFISIPALRNPKLVHGCLLPNDAQAMSEKIRTILRAGHHHGHRTMILGAFGCGAYGNPPEQVAGLFRDVLDEPEFKQAFTTIVFAIIDGSRTDNYSIFKSALTRS